MLTLQSDITQIEKSNLVYIVKNEFDLEGLEFLKLDPKVFTKITEILNKQENTYESFYLGWKNFESLHIFFYLDVNTDIFVFLWEHIAKLPNNLSFFYKNDFTLLDSIVLGKYEFTPFQSEAKEFDLTIISPEELQEKINQRLSTLKNITDARDIVNTPSNGKTPDKYLQYIRSIKFYQTKVKVLDYDDIKREWLGLLEAVGKWSSSKPKLVILERIVDKKLPTLWFVGKGITFDTGGLNIKTGNYMYGMKSDMAGSAALLFMMKEIDNKALNCNVISVLCIAENSISWDAYRPGDILTSYSGKTVEITNTDAEWRLVLADGISYLSKNYDVESITTVATLTWACMVALWYNYAGIMWDNRQFIDTLTSSPTFEKYWELPLDSHFLKKTKGKISDLENYTAWPMAGSSMGWAFLKNFTLNKELFTHIDIAWPAFLEEPYGINKAWATGFWVESLSLLVQNYSSNV